MPTLEARRRWIRGRQRLGGYWTLWASGYRGLRFLGQGKDGPVFRARRGARTVVAKPLTAYGRAFLFMTRALQAAAVEHPALPSLRVVDDRILEYPHEELRPARPQAPELLRLLIEIAGLQQTLLARNLVLWDLGYPDPNYMTASDGSLRWIDFGGNAFLYVSPPEGLPPVPRENLVRAKNRFLQLSLLHHIAVFGLGLRRFIPRQSRLQDDSGMFDAAEADVRAALRGTPYEEPAAAALEADLRTAEGWERVRAALEGARRAVLGGSAPMEAADVSAVRRIGESFEVRGYQNYDVGRDWVRPLDLGHEWALSRRKWEIVDRLLARIAPREYLDIGSNLGLYVFSAAIRHRAASQGVDYNPEYVGRCREINDGLGLACRFRVARYSELEGSFQCVSLLGTLHHLYHRTEDYGDLDPILERLAALCSGHAIVEFPTGGDLKARQWTDMPGRRKDGPYGLEGFLRAAGRFFPRIERAEGCAPDRPVFLLGKGAA